MDSKFDAMINEITTSILGGQNSPKIEDGRTNDDSYARGDSRVVKPMFKVKKKCGCKSKKSKKCGCKSKKHNIKKRHT